MSARAEAIEFAGRAMKRSARIVHREMSQGLSSLATVICVAPFVGVLGTLIGIVNSFKAIIGQWDPIGSMVRKCGDLSQACVPAALGLLVAVPSLWFYKYLTSRLECFDNEMDAASMDALNLLSLRPMYLASPGGVSLVPEAPIFRDDVGRELREDPRAGDVRRLTAVAMLIVAWCVQTALDFYGHEALPIEPAMTSAAVYVFLSFAVSWFVAYPVWVKIFRRASGGLAALASFLCLCWSLTELWWGPHLW